MLPAAVLPARHERSSLRGLVGRLARAWAEVLPPFGRTRLLALGDTCGSAGEAGKGVQTVERLCTLNPSLRLANHCRPGDTLRDAARKAAELPKSAAHLAIVFVTSSDDEMDSSADRGTSLTTIAGVARKVFIVAACTDPGQGSFDALQEDCDALGIEFIRLAPEDGTVRDAPVRSDNFSVDGFLPHRDRPELWTACMLQRPALARLVFH